MWAKLALRLLSSQAKRRFLPKSLLSKNSISWRRGLIWCAEAGTIGYWSGRSWRWYLMMVLTRTSSATAYQGIICLKTRRTVTEGSMVLAITITSDASRRILSISRGKEPSLDLLAHKKMKIARRIWSSTTLMGEAVKENAIPLLILSWRISLIYASMLVNVL